MAQKRKLTDEQIVGVMRHLEATRPAAEMARDIGVRPYAIFAWKAKFGDMEGNNTRLPTLAEQKGFK